MTMSVTVNVMMDGSTVLSVRGEIDHSNAYTLRDNILAAATERRPTVLGVDLGLVTFLDSAAIGQLVAAQREANVEGVRMIVHRAGPVVIRQLRIAGVYDELGAPPETETDFSTYRPG